METSDKDSEESFFSPQQGKYMLRLQVAEKIHERIKKNLLLRKALSIPDYTMRSWLTKAVLRKHELDKLSLTVPKQTQLTVELPAEIEEEINKKITFYKEILNFSFSKKKWVMDAIEEQLEADELELQRKYREKVERK